MSLSDPLKTIKAVVGDANGNVLATSDKGGDVAIVFFKYTFDDDDSDECIIRLQVNNPLAFDTLPIGRSSMLQVAWGYVEGPMTNTAIVVIRDLTTKYGREIIYMELICTDLLVYLNTTRSPDSVQLAFINFITSQFLGKYRVIMKDSGKRIFSLDLLGKDHEARIVLYNTESMLPVDPFEIVDPPITNIQVPLLFPEAYKAIKPEVTPVRVPGKDPWVWHVDEKNEIRQWLERTQSEVPSNKSQLMILREIIKTCPNGPWYITGREKTLLIHNRDFINQPSRVYRYQSEPGDLVDFQARTKYDQFEKNSISHDYYDPKNKKKYNREAYLDELFSMVTFEEKFMDKSLGKAEFKDWLSTYVDLLKAYETWHTTRVPFTIYDPGTDYSETVYIESDKPYVQIPLADVRLASPYAIKPGEPLKYPTPSSRPIEGAKFISLNVPFYDPSIHKLVLRGHVYSTPLEYMEDGENYLMNEIREMEMDKEEAKLIVQGDPFLQSQLRIQVENIHWQHRGLYYIKKCSHILAQEGYKTELEGIKVLSTNKGSIGTTREEIKVQQGEPIVDIEKQWVKEQELFGKPIKIVIPSDKSFVVSNIIPGQGQKVYEAEEVTSLQGEMNKANFISTILELKYSKKAKVVSNVENH